MVNAWDPDLPPGPPMPNDPGDHYTHLSAVLFAAAARVVDGEHRIEADRTEHVIPPLPPKACVLRVHCLGPCGPEGRGAHLAQVWRVRATGSSTGP